MAAPAWNTFVSARQWEGTLHIVIEHEGMPVSGRMARGTLGVAIAGELPAMAIFMTRLTVCRYPAVLNNSCSAIIPLRMTGNARHGCMGSQKRKFRVGMLCQCKC